ncbi:hypothetical protein [Streptosporangium sp. KLBMP 9127]|nr:hypothetical protein [Streptosporangium sp. KLBMP 9127]
MDSESRAAAGLLGALCRAGEGFAGLRHSQVRREVFSRFDPARATTGAVFTLPDGREVRFAVAIGVVGEVFRVEGEISVEERVLLDLPSVVAAGIGEALATLDRYADEVCSRVPWIIDELVDELSA